MATITSESHRCATDSRDRRPSLLREIRTFWHLIFVRAFDPYRPELHYMRGPGPACRAKQRAPGAANPA